MMTHWTQKSQNRRPVGKAISDDNSKGTWQRGGSRKEYTFLAWTTTQKIRKGIFIPRNKANEYVKDLRERKYKRISLNESIRDSDVRRDYKAKKEFNRVVYRVKKV